MSKGNKEESLDEKNKATRWEDVKHDNDGNKDSKYSPMIKYQKEPKPYGLIIHLPFPAQT